MGYVTVAGDFDDGEIGCCTMCCVLGRKCCSSCGNPDYYMVNQERSADIESALQLVVDGKVKIVIDEDAPYAPEDYLKLYEKSMVRKAHGKMLIKFSDDETNHENKTNLDEE